MQGGSDKKGGGGNFLDDWQILRARGIAVGAIQGKLGGSGNRNDSSNDSSNNSNNQNDSSSSGGSSSKSKLIKYKDFLREEKSWKTEDNILFWI